MKKPKVPKLIPLEKLLKSPLQLASLSGLDFLKRHSAPGAAPGIENREGIDHAPEKGALRIQCIDFSETEYVEREFDDIDAFIASQPPRETLHRWVNVDGVHPYVINRLKEHYNLHTLAAEDALHVPQRPKIEDYDESLFVILRMLMQRDGKLVNEQVSVFHLGSVLITIQEASGDVWDMVRQRIRKPGSRFRKFGNDYLLYTLLDAIIDHIFPLIDHYTETLSELEARVLDDPHPDLQKHIHRIKAELLQYRRVIMPTRDVIYTLYRDEDDRLKAVVKPFLRDVYDHVLQLLDVADSYREMSASLHDFYMSAVSNRMNEIMKVLTIMASVFIPITFLAGVYGMNFEHIPELSWEYAYPTFWAICFTMTSGLLLYFWKKRWLRF